MKRDENESATCMTAVALAMLTATVARSDVKDSWITTKAKIALLTSDGFSVNGANVDTVQRQRHHTRQGQHRRGPDQSGADGAAG